MDSLGHLLRERREAFGADLQEAARWCGDKPDWLADKESRDDLSVTDFERICRGLAISPAEFFRGEGNSPQRSVARFRSASGDPKILAPVDLRLLATASQIGLALAELLAMQDRKLPFEPYRKLQGLSPDSEPWEDGYVLGACRETFRVPGVGSTV